MSVRTLSEFYNLMRSLHTTRIQIVQAIKNEERLSVRDLKSLEQIRKQLQDIPTKKGKYKLKTDQGESILLELDYELEELKKDNIFIKHGHHALRDYIKGKHPNFASEVEMGINFLKGKTFKHFFTDRDGTIANYCGRYQSSIQPIYNSLCLSEFAKTIEGLSVILTSAPLFNNGLSSLSIQPIDEYILAGSKGRELFVNGNKRFYPIDKEQLTILEELNFSIEQLLIDEPYKIFKYIGSGLQFKLGQTTIARQDINNSIDKNTSTEFKKSVQQIIKSIDPQELFFSLDDTGYDLEITLKIKDSDKDSKDFTKGDGLNFIMDDLNINLNYDSTLICGDTLADVEMITAAQKHGAQVTSIFVTQDKELIQKVKLECKDCLFVSSPDVLIYMLYKYAHQKKAWSPLNMILSFINF